MERRFLQSGQCGQPGFLGVQGRQPGRTGEPRQFTRTALGDIPYLVTADGRRLCVALETVGSLYHGRSITVVRKDGNERPFPLTEGGRLVFALPGGKRLVSNRVVEAR